MNNGKKETKDKTSQYKDSAQGPSLTTRILNCLQNSVQYMIEEDFEASKLLLDQAWEFLTINLRLQAGERPSVIIENEISKLPSVEAIICDYKLYGEIRNTLSPQLYYDAVDVFGKFYDERGVWASAYLEYKGKQIFKDESSKIRLRIMERLDQSLLLLDEGRGRIKPTAEEAFDKEPTITKAEVDNPRFT